MLGYRVGDSGKEVHMVGTNFEAMAETLEETNSVQHQPIREHIQMYACIRTPSLSFNFLTFLCFWKR